MSRWIIRIERQRTQQISNLKLPLTLRKNEPTEELAERTRQAVVLEPHERSTSVDSDSKAVRTEMHLGEMSEFSFGSAWFKNFRFSLKFKVDKMFFFGKSWIFIDCDTE